MELTPGEKAVLAQIRVLHEAGAREQLLKALIGQWPPAHYQTYRNAYAGLVAKRLIQDINGQAFRVTDFGLRALGLSSVAPAPAQPDPRRAAPAFPQTQPQTRSKPQTSALFHLVKGLLGIRG